MVCAQKSHIAMHISVLRNQRPVEPTDLVVLAIGVVVTLLRAPHFVAHRYHRETQRQHRHREEILHLPVAELLHVGVGGGTFNSPIITSIVVSTVAVAFAIGLVVLAVVGNQIVECEAVVTGHEIDAGLRLALLATVDLRAAEQPIAKWRERIVIPTEKAAHIIAKSPIPLPPIIPKEAAHLVQARRVPRLGDQFCARKHGSRVDIPQDRRCARQNSSPSSPPKSPARGRKTLPALSLLPPTPTDR